MEIDAILAEVAAHGARHACVNGGEPLAQNAACNCWAKLCDAGYDVSLEPAAPSTSPAWIRASRACSTSRPQARPKSNAQPWDNLALLTPRDQVKFVICSRADFDLAKASSPNIACTKSATCCPAQRRKCRRELADWIVAEKLPVRFPMQLHKLLWNDEPGR